MNTNNSFQTSVTFDDIVFTGRNLEYGAYYLRKKYHTYLLLSFLTAFTFVVTAVLGPYLLSTRKMGIGELTHDTPAVLTKIDDPAIPPPPPLPPAPKINVFVVPLVVLDSAFDVDLIKINDEIIQGNNSIAPPIDLVAIAHPKEKDIVDDDIPVLFLEEPATFDGGDLNTFHKWVSEHIKYPEDAVLIGLEGKVTLQFVVGKKGKVEDVTILRGADVLLDKEATRVLLSSPAWKPGRQGGRAVRQQFSLPLTFKLQK